MVLIARNYKWNINKLEDENRKLEYVQWTSVTKPDDTCDDQGSKTIQM